MRLLHEVTGEEVGAERKGRAGDRAAVAAGLHDHDLGRRRALRQTYFKTFPGKLVYSTFDWATRDDDGYYFVLGRTDDVINVAGHRLGTREIEEAVQAHAGVAEVAVVGVADALKGQVPVAFVGRQGPRARRDAERCWRACARKSWTPSIANSAPSRARARCIS